MRMFKVKALSVGALGNKVLKSGDVVPETSWRKGTADELVQKGFLEEVIEKVELPTPPKSDDTDPKADGKRKK